MAPPDAIVLETDPRFPSGPCLSCFFSSSASSFSAWTFSSPVSPSDFFLLAQGDKVVGNLLIRPGPHSFRVVAS